MPRRQEDWRQNRIKREIPLAIAGTVQDSSRVNEKPEKQE